MSCVWKIIIFHVHCPITYALSIYTPLIPLLVNGYILFSFHSPLPWQRSQCTRPSPWHTTQHGSGTDFLGAFFTSDFIGRWKRREGEGVRYGCRTWVDSKVISSRVNSSNNFSLKRSHMFCCLLKGKTRGEDSIQKHKFWYDSKTNG